MDYRITSVSGVADRPALNELLLEFYAAVLRKFAAAGGPPNYSPDNLIASFWPNLHRVLPPTGRLVLVHDANERLVGCGALRQVRPEAKGRRLGRAIVDARIEAARDMGWRTLLVDALRGNTEMSRIYQKLGFRYIDRYPECSAPAEVSGFFIYMQLDLD